MVEPDIYCKVCGMVMQCIVDFYHENRRRPIVLEIGCADGQGTMRYAGFCEHVICIDPMMSGRPDVLSYTKEELLVDQSVLAEFRRRTAEFRVDLIMASSLWEETLSDVKRLLKDRNIDVLVIDGCHHPFEAVWKDFETYSPLVSSGGFIIFDDLYEACIEMAYDKARELSGFTEHERWKLHADGILQEVASLKVSHG